MIKSKFIILVTMLVLLFSVSSISAFASEKNMDKKKHPNYDSNVYNITDYDVDLKDRTLYTTEQAEIDLAKHRKEQSNQGVTTASLNVPLMSQGDSRWASKILNGCSPDTIQKSGCTVTSAASMMSFYGFNSDPSILNTQLGSNACPFNWDAMQTYAAGGNKVKVNKAQRDQGFAAFNPMAQVELDYGRPVIVGMIKNGQTHFVLARGYIRYADSYTPTPNDYSVMDPDGGFYRSLGDYLNNGWVIHRAYSYIKI